MNNSTDNYHILVTGGAGFIGSHLVDELVQRGYIVRVLDNLWNGSLENLIDAFKKSNFSFLQGDILDPETCKKAMKDVDIVFHLACLGVRHSIHSPFENHRVNAEGTLQMLEAARQEGVKHFYYISTSEIYGRTNSFPITEEAPANPLTVYGASKLTGEHYTHAYRECYGVSSTVLRIFNNYGPRAHYEGDAGEIIPRSIVKILYNQPPLIFGDGSITRDFFYVKDTASALANLLFIENLNGLTINIGTGKEISMKELVTYLLQVMQREELGIQFLPSRPADVPQLWVDAAKFYKLTKFKPAYTFQDGLAYTVAYYQEKLLQKDLISQIENFNWIKSE
jgi:UDP-glucose 4-epimerase